MSDIFREVDEAMQQEKMLNIWKEYGSTIIAALVILVISTAAGTYYKKWDAKRDAQETARLSTALQADDPQAAIMDVIKDTRKGHSALGLMSAAHLHLQNGKKEESAVIFKQIVDNKKSPRNLRDLARILYVQNSNEADDKILKPLLVNSKSPWIWHARIEAAVMAAHGESADYSKAISHLKDFKEASYIPQSLKQRANALQHIYTLKSKQEQASKTETQ